MARLPEKTRAKEGFCHRNWQRSAGLQSGPSSRRRQSWERAEEPLPSEVPWARSRGGHAGSGLRREHSSGPVGPPCPPTALAVTPVRPQAGRRAKGCCHPKVFSHSKRDATGHPEMISHIDPFTGSRLELPLGGNDLSICPRNLDADVPSRPGK